VLLLTVILRNVVLLSSIVRIILIHLHCLGHLPNLDHIYTAGMGGDAYQSRSQEPVRSY